MKEIYYLNQKEVATLPSLHDCVIKEIQLNNNCLIFVFEDDISYHDGITTNRPGVKTVIVTYHFMFDIDDLRFYINKRRKRFLHKTNTYKEIDIVKDSKILTKLTSKNVEYLYHYVSYNSIIIKLHAWAYGDIVLDMCIDTIEYEWL